MPSRERFKSGRLSIVQQPEYQEKVKQAFLSGEKPCITIKNLKISRSTYYRILSALGITILSSLHGGHPNSTQEQTSDISYIQSFLDNNPVPESIGKHYKGIKTRSYQRRDSSK